MFILNIEQHYPPQISVLRNVGHTHLDTTFEVTIEFQELIMIQLKALCSTCEIAKHNLM